MTQLAPGAGVAFPLGASITDSGVNFSIFSSHAEGMHLVLFDSEDSLEPSRTITLDTTKNRTGHYWHVEVPGVRAGQVYGYRADGPLMPQNGYWFDGDKLLVDPYGKGVSTKLYRRNDAARRGENLSTSLRSVVVDTSGYDWEGDRPLCLSFRETVIYELHVGGFTLHPNSGVPEHERGTFLGLTRKIPYLKALGITAVELMPIFQFDSQDAPEGLENYWGYSPISFFAPHLGYSTSRNPAQCITEFRDMVKALHRAGIEVILDVVYNHTAEGGSDGPTLGFKGLDSSLYYMFTPDRSRFVDYTGTGNTLNANQSVVRRMILDSLRYWVSEMHVDGFRFDLASVLSRDETGVPVSNSPVVWDIDSDPALAGIKLIAEAWDASGLYQVGSFSKDHWKEWNGRFRDDVRSFMKSDPGTIHDLRQRLLGSPDIYAEKFHPPEQSINFVTCHDGFTMNDLVSYNQKHNEANGRLDGTDANISWNCGVEGPSQDPTVESLRARQIRNAFALTLFSIGTPMILMGDEVRRTQQGNNNAYCQNNAISWFDWDLCRTHEDTLRFVSTLIRLRQHIGSIVGVQNLSLREFLDMARLEWHGVKLHCPDFSYNSHTLAVTAYLKEGPAIHIMLNAYWEPLRFAVPATPPGTDSWIRVIDTYLDPAPDLLHQKLDQVWEDEHLVQPRSLVLLGAAPESIIQAFSSRF